METRALTSIASGILHDPGVVGTQHDSGVGRHHLSNSAQQPSSDAGHIANLDMSVEHNVHLCGRTATSAVRHNLPPNSNAPALSRHSFDPALTRSSQRFAFFTATPIFLLQLCLVITAIYSLLASRRPSSSGRVELEKSHEHELGQYNRQSSLDTKGGSPKSTATETAQILPAKQQV
jgi:hypothetical protein